MVVSMNFSIPPSALVSRFKGGFIMGKTIKNDYELAHQLTSFFRRLSSACDHSSVTGNYIASVAKTLSTQEDAFFASTPVRFYGQLETPCTNNLPYYIDADLITKRVLDFVDDGREIAVMRNNAASNFKPSIYVDFILDLDCDWPASVYSSAYEEGILWIGKRHPIRIAQESLKSAARYDSDKLFDKALFAIENYITIDTSILEVYKRVAQCYEDNWGESDIDAPCELSVLAKLFDPYAKKADPELDYRYREKQITHELITHLANRFI